MLGCPAQSPYHSSLHTRGCSLLHLCLWMRALFWLWNHTWPASRTAQKCQGIQVPRSSPSHDGRELVGEEPSFLSLDCCVRPVVCGLSEFLGPWAPCAQSSDWLGTHLFLAVFLPASPFPLPSTLLFPGFIPQINHLPLNPCLSMHFLGNPTQDSSPRPHLLFIVEFQTPACLLLHAYSQQDFRECPGGSHTCSETSLVSYHVFRFSLLSICSGHPASSRHAAISAI